MATINLDLGTTAASTESRSLFRSGHWIASGAALLLCAAALFLKLGAPALFEPDEGRNAEKAREILLLDDWITPHENFLVVLDKPIFYYWLVAASYETFGVSEWSARLTSALAAAGCVLLIFLFARRFCGLWEGLWSGVVLATSLEFYILGRTVIFDMTLTFFITLSLFSFFSILHEDKTWLRRSWLGLMYVSLGIATLVKGPIGAALPSVVVFVYLLISRKLPLLRRLDLHIGIPLFLLIVAPWYYEVERFNPGYLRYFLWEENFVRYFTPHFNRTEPWYYFLLILAVGFLPWSLAIPRALSEAWRGRRNDIFVFLLAWTVLPFVFFSFSSAKLPHYILPIFPPLALLTGISLQHNLTASRTRAGLPLVLACLSLSLLVAGFVIAAGWSHSLQPAAQFAFAEISPLLRGTALLMAIGFAGLALFTWSGRWKSRVSLFVCLSIALILYVNLLGTILVGASMRRSTRDLVAKASSYIQPDTQVVIYDTSLESLPFYLKINRPIWSIWSGEKASVFGSFYLAEKGAVAAAPGFGRPLLTFDEFNREWANAPKNHFAVFIKRKSLPRLVQDTKYAPTIRVEHGSMLLVSN
ncbi:MAG TPA: glycosyltransferase family 39 protein [Candidatus Binatia bacterium]|jgi:4-amino-4-deoxy-L-arabinose transferase-like glycosyltransferase